ncbi:endonuclease/exonuclease/phosphatase family protein [uncultured Winogradskyella sp.]|uniref:endonuclease/exonuclease/phosphatase family protein n=1 Tax=uncultured Winogradskyella sp. TaxID=395353 RepID=UPI002636437E|nr:endonuclease/exonuclease/phosphatase family protein [uncultured Winogradskyella sp.]
MKHILTISLLMFLTILPAQELNVMSYNIKLDAPKEGKNSWTNRKAFFINQIKFHEPDVLGVQEAMPNQMMEMDSLLVDYSFVGVGRDDGKDKGEYSAIFYKKDKFQLESSNTFWLSETPDKVSMGWDAVCNRVCTYALFKNIDTGKKFYLFNTHFDHVGKVARVQSAVLIDKKIKEINTENYPVVLSGDFNMEDDHESIQFLSKNLNDSKNVAELTFGPIGTYNGFHFDQPVIRRIDYLFVSKDIDVKKYAVLSDSWDLKYPSDHFPIMISFNL